MAANQKEIPMEDAGMADLHQKMAEMAERMEALEARNAELERLSRDQERHDASPVHEEHDVDYWEEPGIRNHPMLREPRPGMAQMWVTTHLRGEPYPELMFKKLNQGWRPRLASTLPKELRGTMKLEFEGAEVIGVRGAILCERPVEVHDLEQRAKAQTSRRWMRSVEARLAKTKSPRDYGFGEPHFEERRSRVVRGSPESLIDSE